MTRSEFIRSIVQDPDDPDGALLDLGEDICCQLGWAEGDTIKWTDNGDGTWLLTKKADNADNRQ